MPLLTADVIRVRGRKGRDATTNGRRENLKRNQGVQGQILDNVYILFLNDSLI